MRTFGALMLVLAMVVTVGCRSEKKSATRTGTETTQPGVGAAPGAAATGSWTAQKEFYHQTFQTQINRLDAQIRDFQAQAANAASDQKKRLDDAVKDLQDQRSKAQDDLQKVDSATQDNWDSVKSSVDKSIRDLQDDYNKTLNKVGVGAGAAGVNTGTTTQPAPAGTE